MARHGKRPEMLQIDLQCSFVVGSLMAHLARRRLRTASPAWLASTRTVVMAFGGIVFAPVWTYITLAWTPWESMYNWDRSTIPVLLVAAFVPGLSVAAMLGFWVTQHLLVTDRPRLALVVNGAVAATVVAIVAVGWRRATFVGTLEQFRAGPTPNILESDLARMLVVATVLVFAPAGILIYRWLRDSDPGTATA
jgi:hypothetical protein